MSMGISGRTTRRVSITRSWRAGTDSRFLPVAMARLGAIFLFGLVGCTSSQSPAPVAELPAASSVAPDSRVQPPAPAGRPRDAFVLLSGGGTPLSNNYSHYLQAQALAAFFAQRYPAAPAWIFFGVGNRPGERPRLADVYREVKRDGQPLDSWLAGALPGNRSATREGFLKALREEILPTVRDGGTLFLFVGDHGELTRGDGAESAVTLWQLKPNALRGESWVTDDNEILRVSDLRAALAEGLGRGRVVFCMTQCHSGGFHYLGVPRIVTPPRDWFTVVPEWAKAGRTAPALRVAGFSATDEESLAAGCDPDPDPEKWAGYERFAPEGLLGRDLMTNRLLAAPRASFAAAHEAAVLVDRTIDKPRSSSEQYLERWATLIEKRLAGERWLTEKTSRALAAFQRAVNTGAIQTDRADVRGKQAQFGQFTARLIEQSAGAKDLLQTGTRRQLERAIGADEERRGGPRGGGRRRGLVAAARRAWTETLRPGWKAEVLAPGSALLSGAALEFEKHLLQLEDRGTDFMVGRQAGDAMLNEIYWRSGYAHPETLELAKAEAVARWGGERRGRIVAWAESSSDAARRSAAEKIAAVAGLDAEEEPEPPVGTVAPVSRRTAAERVLFYRRVLAAWEFLLTMEDRAALEQLQALLELERTPLPPSTP